MLEVNALPICVPLSATDPVGITGDKSIPNLIIALGSMHPYV
jgi:hypothetical protein